MLEEFLTNRNLFQSIASGQIPLPDLTTTLNFDAAKRWQIFSRIRFEYVRPTCTLRSQCVPSVCPSMPEDERDYGIKEYLKSGLFPDKETIAKFKKAIQSPIPGSLAFYLREYYDTQCVPVPGADASLFPASYILIHDLHHVLLGSNVSQKGEMEVIAFESGMLQKCDPPILLLEQLEIFFSDMTDALDSIALVKAWNIGKNASTQLFENWNWTDDLDLSLESVREKYGLLSLR